MKPSDFSGNKTYFKRNYGDALEILIPKTYIGEDISLSGLDKSPVTKLINTHLLVASNFSSVIPIASGSNLTSLSGATKHFYKENYNEILSPYDFESLFLFKLNKSLKDFSTSTLFSEYVSGTLLPNIRLGSPTYSFDLSSTQATDNYLSDTLSWLHLLNFVTTTGFSPSSLVHDLYVNKIYNGESVLLVDGIKALTEYIWRNYTACSFSNYGLIPTDYLAGSSLYTSGASQLEKLKTIVEVAYSPLHADVKDSRVKDAFEDYLTTRVFLEDKESNGPFRKFINAVSYSIYDVNSEIDGLNLLYDIEKCPIELLPFIANLIGWNLLGHNPEKWRSQLRNATLIYKAKGTKKALQLALDAAFGDEVFDLSSNIVELWESYIPNILYYAIATESSALASFDTWTQEIANSLGIPDYSSNSMDTNIRFVVDDILKDAVIRFPDLFFVGNKRFNLEDPTFIFQYRGRIINIPPWESEKYYRYCQINESLLNYFYNRLVCLGIDKDFAYNVINYIRLNTIESNNHRNKWLFFTEEVQYPPNYEKIIIDLRKKNIDYLSIWNGKSSHFNVTLDASSFLYNKYSYGVSSYQGLKTIGRVINEFTPAHAIPNTDLNLNDVDFAGYNDKTCISPLFKPDDLQTASSVMQGYGYLAANMSAGSGIYKYDAVDSLLDDLMSTSASLSLPRNSLRRRGYNNVLDHAGWYTRTGFNMPAFKSTSSFPNFNTYIPLGYIPSANKFAPASSDIYNKCNTYDSSNSYFGYAVSSTFPCRGLSSLDISSCDPYARREDCHEIIPLIFNRYLASSYNNTSAFLSVSSNASSYAGSSYVDLVLSLTNLDSGPSSVPDYYRFKFSRGVQELYKLYSTIFSGHEISLSMLDNDGGFDIFSHTYGNCIFNGYFTYNGSAADAYSLITSSLSVPVKINSNNGSGLMSVSATASGTYIASSLSSLYVQTYEFRNPHILSGVELIDSSGAPQSNEFIVYNISDEEDQVDVEDSFIFTNSFIRFKNTSFTGLQRIKFDLARYGLTPNKFIKDHKYKITARCFVGREGGTSIGGGSIGMWIHTSPENGYYWAWTRDNKWQIFEASSASVSQIISQSHLFQYPYENITSSTTSSIEEGCYNELIINNQINLVGINNLTSSLFKDFSVEFDTENYKICVPNYYYNINRQVHNDNQNYCVEIFMLPDTTNTIYTILDYVSGVSLTNNEYSNGFTNEELVKILKYFLDIRDLRASRTASLTSSTFNTSGGSRINYRYHPMFGTYTLAANQAYTLIDINR